MHAPPAIAALGRLRRRTSACRQCEQHDRDGQQHANLPTPRPAPRKRRSGRCPHHHHEHPPPDKARTAHSSQLDSFSDLQRAVIGMSGHLDLADLVLGSDSRKSNDGESRAGGRHVRSSECQPRSASPSSSGSASITSSTLSISISPSPPGHPAGTLLSTGCAL